jgi:hypothetical protein
MQLPPRMDKTEFSAGSRPQGATSLTGTRRHGDGRSRRIVITSILQEGGSTRTSGRCCRNLASIWNPVVPS